MPTKPIRNPGGIIFLIGIFLGLALAIMVIWAAIEAQAYYYTGAVYEPFNGLHCPLFMTRSETGTISVTFDNPGNQEINPYYKLETSGPLPQRFENQLSVPPHTSKSVAWTVDERDIDLGSFIFAQLKILPKEQALCGIFVLNIPGLTGEQFFIAALLISLSAIAIGFTLWNRALGNASINLNRAAQALGVSVLGAMLFAFIGWTLVGLIFSIIAILLLIILLRFAVA